MNTKKSLQKLKTRFRAMVILAVLVITSLTIAGCSSTTTKAVAVSLEGWEQILTSPDYQGCYIVHERNWRRAQDRLKELRGKLNIEHTESTEYTVFPSKDYYIVKKEFWTGFLKEIVKLETQIKLNELDT